MSLDKEKKAKNILFIFADQMHRFALGCMGNDDVLTPNLNKLAEQGVLFKNAYSNCPICTPFRGNLFTGLYSSQSGVTQNDHALPIGYECLADYLNQGGYHTSFVGKWHLGAKGKGNKPIPQKLQGGFTDFMAYQCYNGFKDNVCFYDKDERKYEYKYHRTEVTTDLAIERLEKAASADKPFVMFVGYQSPHYPVQPANEYEEMYRNKKITLRPNCDVGTEPYTPTYSPTSPSDWRQCPDFQRYGGDLEEYIRLYYAMVTQVDANIGRLIRTLEVLGMKDNTIVIFTSDHGDMQGSHGLKNKVLPYEESAGIPLIISHPDGVNGCTSELNVSGIDFYPTILDYAGLSQKDELPGNNLAPITLGQDVNIDGQIFSQACTLDNWIMTRKGDYKLVVEGEEHKVKYLFDIKNDVYEMNNLIDSKQHEKITEDLFNDILNWKEYITENSLSDSMQKVS